MEPAAASQAPTQLESIARALLARSQTLVTVECSLCGALGSLLTSRAGSSAWYSGGVAPYSLGAKRAWLGLDGDALGPDGAVSPRAARLMAVAARGRIDADWALVETGIAGPRGGRRSSKSPGTLHLCILGPDDRMLERTLNTNLDDRDANRRAFLAAAIDLLVEAIHSPTEQAL